MRKLSVLMVAALFVSANAISETTVELVSEPGDSIGQGAAYSYDDTNSTIVFSRNFDNGITMRILPLDGGTSGDRWTLNFASPQNLELTVGTYERATRYPFQDFEDPGLSFSGNGRGCNTLTGSFDILVIEYDENNELVSLVASFEQFCGNSPYPLRGEVVFNSVRPVGVKTISLDTSRIQCRNRTTGEVVVDRAPISEIADCGALGLEINPGDDIRITVFGTAAN